VNNRLLQENIPLRTGRFYFDLSVKLPLQFLYVRFPSQAIHQGKRFMPFIPNIFAKSLPYLSLLTFLLIHPGFGFAGPYALSAHGNTGYGVLRTVLSGTYLQGNCGHCHEQHTATADGYLLIADSFNSTQTGNPYDQADNVCFSCHTVSGSAQSGGISNNSYSVTFGGKTAVPTEAGIFEAFNLSSYHNLYDLQRYITGVVGSKTFSNFPTDSNPCSGCHNIHLAKANKQSPGDPTNTALSKPSDHETLWGDDSPGERMTSYGTAYQPPLHATAAPNLEPDGASSDQSTQTAKTPDYNGFCCDCHNASNTIYSTTLGRNLRTIDWNTEKHGSGNADTYINVDSPYSAGSGSLGYVLACTDCHEPHGSSNAYLLRPTVNGTALSGAITGSDTSMRYLCARCHEDDNQSIHHSLNDYPYSAFQCGNCHVSLATIACTNCHYHGSSKTDCRTPATRITF
jgi:hypothetical protein